MEVIGQRDSSSCWRNAREGRTPPANGDARRQGRGLRKNPQKRINFETVLGRASSLAELCFSPDGDRDSGANSINQSIQGYAPIRKKAFVPSTTKIKWKTEHCHLGFPVQTVRDFKPNRSLHFQPRQTRHKIANSLLQVVTF